MADNRLISVFGAYATEMQAMFDARQDKFKTMLFPSYMDFGTPQVGLTYSTVIGRSRIEAAASVVAHGAPAPLRSRAGLEKLDGEVAAIKVKRALNEKQYRDFLVLQNMKVTDEAKKLQSLKLMWEDGSYVVNAVLDRLDIMFAQGTSTGKIALGDNSNPDGIIQEVDLLMPATNINKVVVAWSIANKATMTPIADIKAAIEAGEAKGITAGVVKMPKALFYIVANCTEVNNLLKGFFRISTGGTLSPTMSQINEYLSANMLPVIEVVDVVKSYEKDGKLIVLRPWKAENVAILPIGKLGIIHNAMALEELVPVPGTSYAKANNVHVAKWYSNEPWGEFTRGELTAFPGFEAIDSMQIITTDVAA